MSQFGEKNGAWFVRSNPSRLRCVVGENEDRSDTNNRAMYLEEWRLYEQRLINNELLSKLAEAAFEASEKKLLEKVGHKRMIL